jgi:hypothetical protein
MLLYPGSPQIVPWHRIQDRGKVESKLAFHTLNWLIAKWANITTEIVRLIGNEKKNRKEHKRNVNLIYPKMKRKKCGYKVTFN